MKEIYPKLLGDWAGFVGDISFVLGLFFFLGGGLVKHINICILYINE